MKCLFDNNLPPKLAKTLNYLEGENGVVVEHIKNKFSSDTPDVEWIEKLSKEGGWFVVTKDSQIRKKPHEKKAWQESNIPIVFLLKSWVKLDFWEIAWRFIKCWPELIEAIKLNDSVITFELAINGKITAIK